tara:strand:- start:1451 stop:2305 length:855 start_codon:yes stop_codon:yes gene_type:complete
MIIWIASYPKSGNTWIRSLIGSYFFTKTGVFNFDVLKNIKQFSPVISDSIINEKLHYQSKVSQSWIPSQININKDNKIHFLKTHNAMCSINGNNFTDKFNTSAAIYIVRDPRNVLSSISHHYEINHKQSLEFITNKRKIIYPIKSGSINKSNEKDFNFLSDWSTHYNSWKNMGFCPIKIIKYEDIILDNKETFISILNFLSKFIKIKFDDKKIDNSLSSTTFDKLSSLEKKVGFEESIYSKKINKKIRFFNLGKENKWKKILDKNIVKNVEKAFNKEMSELGYL